MYQEQLIGYWRLWLASHGRGQLPLSCSESGIQSAYRPPDQGPRPRSRQQEALGALKQVSTKPQRCASDCWCCSCVAAACGCWLLILRRLLRQTFKQVENFALGVQSYAFVLPFYAEENVGFGMLGEAGTPLRTFAGYAQAIRALAHTVYVADMVDDSRFEVRRWHNQRSRPGTIELACFSRSKH